MAFNNKNSIDMVNGPLWGKIFKYSTLFMATALLQQLYSAADIMVVGRYAGANALAGVGTSSVLSGLFLNFIIGLSAGATVVIGHALGAGHKDEIHKAAHTSIAVAILGGFIITVLCILFTRPLLYMVGVPDEVYPEASIYLRITAVDYIPALVYNFGVGILRAKGDTKRALYIVSIAGVINVLLNLFFVCVCHMGAGGVALATLISKSFSAACIMYILCHEPDEMRINLKKLRIYKKPFLRILRFGLPSGIQSSVYSASNILIQSGINSFGATATAGHAAASSIINFYGLMSTSLYNTAMVFTSQNFGAKKFERIKKVFIVCMVYSVVYWGVQSLVTWFGGKFLVGLYTPGQPNAFEYGWRELRLLGYVYGFLGVLNILSGMLRGIGASFVNMITSIIGVCGIRIVWLLTVFKVFHIYEILFWSYPISWIGTSILHFIMFTILFKKEKKKALQI